MVFLGGFFGFFLSKEMFCDTQLYTLLNEIYKVDKKDQEKHIYWELEMGTHGRTKIEGERGQLKRKGEKTER